MSRVALDPRERGAVSAIFHCSVLKAPPKDRPWRLTWCGPQDTDETGEGRAAGVVYKRSGGT
eukprot:6123888-Prymnesium_polylepis.1